MSVAILAVDVLRVLMGERLRDSQVFSLVCAGCQENIICIVFSVHLGPID